MVDNDMMAQIIETIAIQPIRVIAAKCAVPQALGLLQGMNIGGQGLLPQFQIQIQFQFQIHGLRSAPVQQATRIPTLIFYLMNWLAEGPPMVDINRRIMF